MKESLKYPIMEERFPKMIFSTKLWIVHTSKRLTSNDKPRLTFIEERIIRDLKPFLNIAVSVKYQIYFSIENHFNEFSSNWTAERNAIKWSITRQLADTHAAVMKLIRQIVPLWIDVFNFPNVDWFPAASCKVCWWKCQLTKSCHNKLYLTADTAKYTSRWSTGKNVIGVFMTGFNSHCQYSPVWCD